MDVSAVSVSAVSGHGFKLVTESQFLVSLVEPEFRESQSRSRSAIDKNYVECVMA